MKVSPQLHLYRSGVVILKISVRESAHVNVHAIMIVFSSVKQCVSAAQPGHKELQPRMPEIAERLHSVLRQRLLRVGRRAWSGSVSLRHSLEKYPVSTFTHHTDALRVRACYHVRRSDGGQTTDGVAELHGCWKGEATSKARHQKRKKQ